MKVELQQANLDGKNALVKVDNFLLILQYKEIILIYLKNSLKFQNIHRLDNNHNIKTNIIEKANQYLRNILQKISKDKLKINLITHKRIIYRHNYGILKNQH